MSDLIELSHQLRDVILELKEAGCWETTTNGLAHSLEDLEDQIDEEALEDD